MKHLIITSFIAAAAILAAGAQQKSSSSVVRRVDSGRNTQTTSATKTKSASAANRNSDADLQWLRIIYRSANLDNEANSPLAYHQQNGGRESNLFATMLRLVAQGSVPAYEYIDGRERFTESSRVKPEDVFERFAIPFTPAKGGARHQTPFVFDDADIPSEDVACYYIIERWEFNRHENRMQTHVEAICPVISRAADFGMEPLRFPVFWVRMDDLRPYLDDTLVSAGGDNDLATHTLNDFFNLRLYKADIYKTGRDKPLARTYQTPEALQHARDSIERRLTDFDRHLWVPSLEEVAAVSDSTKTKQAGPRPAENRKASSAGKSKRPEPTKIKRKSSGRSNVTRSVRNRKQ